MIRLKILLLLAALLLAAQPALAQQPTIRVEIVAAQVNVRAAPGGEIIGTLTRGALVDVTTLSADGAWLGFRYWERPAWLTANPAYVRSYGDINQLRASFAIRLLQYSISPEIPEPGAPFKIALTLQADQAVGAFRLAATCAEFAYATVPRLAAGAAQTITLDCPGDPATGPHTTALVLDVDQAVSPGATQDITYFVDRPYIQVAMNWPAHSDLNVDGGAYDFSTDGQVIKTRPGAHLYKIPEELLTLADIHYDSLTAPETFEELPAAGLIGIVSVSGKPGVLQVIRQEADGLLIEFRIYPGG